MGCHELFRYEDRPGCALIFPWKRMVDEKYMYVHIFWVSVQAAV